MNPTLNITQSLGVRFYRFRMGQFNLLGKKFAHFDPASLETASVAKPTGTIFFGSVFILYDHYDKAQARHFASGPELSSIVYYNIVHVLCIIFMYSVYCASVYVSRRHADALAHVRPSRIVIK